MKVICDKQSCTGCSSCCAICPKAAIHMEADEKGFLYPVIDKAKCIDCGLCKKVCPIENEETKNFEKEIVEAYLAKNELEIRKKSSSGGIFTSLAEEVLNRQGVIYGAEFSENFVIRHARASSYEEMTKFRGSKYAQSNIGNVYLRVLEDLVAGKTVYFSGCPCQVAGLLSFLKSKHCNTEKLYTQDFVCHGVASPLFFRDYLEYYAKKYHSAIKSINFRGKPKPGKFQNMTIEFANGKKYLAKSSRQDIFYYHFSNDIVLRPSCYVCRFAKTNRVADVTLADCFKPKADMVDFDDKLGVSFVLANSEKGIELVQGQASGVEIVAVNHEDYIQMNMKKPTQMSKLYSSFWSEYTRSGFKKATKKYGNRNLRNDLMRGMSEIIYYTGLEKILKRIMKKS